VLLRIANSICWAREETRRGNKVNGTPGRIRTG